MRWRWSRSCALALAVFVVAPSASAQEQPGGVTSNEEKMADAKRQFDAGVSLLEDPDGAKYEDAYRAFKKAFELSQSPKVLGNLAFCAMHLERDGEAIDAYTTYLRDTPDVSERERLQIQRDLATMTATVSRLKISVKNNTSSVVLLDKRQQTRGAPVENTYSFDGHELSIRVRPGRHTISVQGQDGQSAPIDIVLEPGATMAHEVTLQKVEPAQGGDSGGTSVRPREQPSLVGPVAMGAFGLLAVGVGAVTGIVARGKTSDIEAQCPNDVCPATYTAFDSDKSSAKTFGTVADVAFVSGGLLLGGALIWYLALPKGGSPKAAATSSAPAWRPTAMCTGDGCGFQIQRGW